MQTAGSESDSAIVQTMGSIFRTNDWTDIYALCFILPQGNLGNYLEQARP